MADYTAGADQTKIAQYEQVIANASTVQADLSSEYFQKTLKIMRLPKKTYDFDYVFYIDSRPFSGKVTFHDLPEARNVILYYLSSDPRVFSLDPRKEPKNGTQKESSGYSLYWGILWGLQGIYPYYHYYGHF